MRVEEGAPASASRSPPRPRPAPSRCRGARRRCAATPAPRRRARPRPPCRRRCRDRTGGRRARAGSNGSRRPPLDVAGRLHVVVRVEQHGRRVGPMRPLADHVWGGRRRRGSSRTFSSPASRSSSATDAAHASTSAVCAGSALMLGMRTSASSSCCARRRRRERRRGDCGVDRPRLSCRDEDGGRSSSYQRGAFLRAHAAGTEPLSMLSSASPSRSANAMWPSTAIQMPNANQSCTNVAPVRQSSGNEVEPLHDRAGAEHHDAARRR